MEPNTFKTIVKNNLNESYRLVSVAVNNAPLTFTLEHKMLNKTFLFTACSSPVSIKRASQLHELLITDGNFAINEINTDSVMLIAIDGTFTVPFKAPKKDPHQNVIEKTDIAVIIKEDSGKELFSLSLVKAAEVFIGRKSNEAITLITLLQDRRTIRYHKVCLASGKELRVRQFEIKEGNFSQIQILETETETYLTAIHEGSSRSAMTLGLENGEKTKTMLGNQTEFGLVAGETINYFLCEKRNKIDFFNLNSGNFARSYKFKSNIKAVSLDNSEKESKLAVLLDSERLSVFNLTRNESLVNNQEVGIKCDSVRITGKKVELRNGEKGRGKVIKF